MSRQIAIGIQNFEEIIQNNYFYIDKTDFIKEWWNNGDSVTLITRPRRFGKTLTISMVETFFSNKYDNRGDLFENLNIWEDEKFRKLQGTYPVISLSFASIKEHTFEEAKKRIYQLISNLYEKNRFLLDSGLLGSISLDYYNRININMDETDATLAIYQLSDYMSRYYGKKVIILLDEYDTPMQEAYINGYWDEFASFIRNLFNATFKTNPYMERAIMTGITRVSKESIFSDLNNLEVVTTTSDKYATSFGFTEEEVFDAMDEQNLGNKSDVKFWYDGFVFGNVPDIYNPWSIINYLNKKKITAYWANTSSNSLVGKLIRESGAKTKQLFERLLNGDPINVSVDEQIIYNHLDTNDGAIWSLMLATGYLKVLEYQTGGQYTGNRKPVYKLALTNEEVKTMFYQMVSDWFGKAGDNYNDFITALIEDDLDAMNEYMEKVTLQIFSSFDTGGRDSDFYDSDNITDISEQNRKALGRKSEPERFYHGFVLGLLVDMSENYIVKSNRESGFGRYDIMIYPRNIMFGNGMIIEFKVRNPRKEKSLAETVKSALKQIDEKNYAAELRNLGFKEENIKKYGFAFEGKHVLIG